MKKSFGTKLSCFVIVSAVSIISTYAQTCENSGIGITTPTSKLHIKGCGNTTATSSLHVMNSSNTPLLFVKDNGYVGIGTSNPLSSLDVTGWQYIRDSGYPMLMMNSSNANATKDLGIHFDGYGATPSHEFRLGRYTKSSGAWEANVIRLSMMAPEGSLLLTSTGNFGVMVGAAVPSYRLQVKAPMLDAPNGQHGQVAAFQDYNGTAQTFFSVKSPAAVWNPLTAANDNGIFWQDDGTVESANGLVIAPWSGSSKGIRIDGVTGNLSVGVTASSYKIEAAGDIYANQGSLMASKSSAEGGSVAIFNHTKTTAGQNLIYRQWNMTGGYGDKLSVWGYPQTGSGAERFSIWDNGDISFHNAAGVSVAKFTNSGNFGINVMSPTESFQISNNIALHDGGDKLLAFLYAPTPNTDLDATKYAAEMRFTPSNGNISFGISSSITTLPVTRLVLDKTGNLGLGTSGPSAILHLKDGHIRSEQATPPGILVTTQNGITAAALATGSTDTKGTITTTGDNNGTNTIITVTFNKTCSVTPVVVVSATNASGQAYTFFANAGINSFTLNLKDAGTNATPAFNYIVIE